ncbi:heptaprenyl diphosphate synthase component 1 [Sporosarcina sp. HYO08]|uniref:heptaprenyl diphosphate synthase component 1 n=1 Tax=Sporosarcina sp. HYO08 TaxID=1759557 RepID=UPI000799257D|nr:heptaprenyl diphosphate synthase component 1 [Sporosarcina sp. HYO08]KXH82025.1 hypothetical protein AU377_07170 [Sporosarcina sp. HYO08]
MERQKIKQHIENYQITVTQTITEPIIEREIGPIDMAVNQAFFLLLPMLNGERLTESMYKAAVAVGAVHAAFAAHDTIDEWDATSKEQQLTVLSGDYFSGIHYRILASLPDFDFIRSLSQTIASVNERKATMRMQTDLNLGDLMDSLQIIEAGCIVDYFQSFGFERYAAIASVALPLLTLREGKSPLYEKQKLTDEALALFHSEMAEALEQADFLAPFLNDEIRRMTSPLLGKLN